MGIISLSANTRGRVNRGAPEDAGGGGSSFEFVGVSAAATGTGSVVISYPAGKAAGQLAVVVIGKSNGNAITAASGWTLALTANRNGHYWRILDGTEGSTATFTIAGGADLAARMACFNVPADSTPVDVTAAQGAVNTGDVILPAVNPTTGASLIMQITSGAKGVGETPTAHGGSSVDLGTALGPDTTGAALRASYLTTTAGSVSAVNLPGAADFAGFYNGSRVVYAMAEV